MNVRLKRAKELMGYAVQLTKDEGLPTMVKRGAGFVRRRFFGKRARYLPGKKVLEAQAAEMVGKTAENCGLPTISILTPLYNTPENYLREFLDSFVNQTAPNGQLCLADASDDAHPEVERVVREYQRKNQRIVYKKVENKGIAANTNAAETLATGEYLALADHDDVLAPHAMYAMGKAVLQLREKGEPDGFLYSDEALFTKDIKKPMVGHFKPDYAPDYLLCCNYICHLAVFKRALYEQLGGERPECDGSQDHDLFLRLIEQTGGAAHLPQVLYYWRVHAGSTSGGTDAKPYVAAAAKKALADHLSRTGRTGTVEDGLFPSTYRVKWDIEGDPKVSILIPNKDHTDDLEKCLYSIWSKTEWDNFEVIVIENNSTDPATFAYYKDAEKRYEGLKVVTWPEKGFNFSAINNFGRKAAQGEYLLLLNNDVEVRNGDWLTELLRQCAHPGGAAICGAMLYYPDETLQHAGVVTGLGGYAGHSHKYKKAGGSGYLFRAATVQDFSAVTGACLLVRTSVWDEVKGLDEKFAVVDEAAVDQIDDARRDGDHPGQTDEVTLPGVLPKDGVEPPGQKAEQVDCHDPGQIRVEQGAVVGPPGGLDCAVCAQQQGEIKAEGYDGSVQRHQQSPAGQYLQQICFLFLHSISSFASGANIRRCQLPFFISRAYHPIISLVLYSILFPVSSYFTFWTFFLCRLSPAATARSSSPRPSGHAAAKQTTAIPAPPSATAASCKGTPPVSQSANRCRRASPAPALTAPAKPGAPSHRQSCSRRPQLDSSRPVLAVQV